MQMKERVETILGGFLKRNEDYVVYAYLRNGITERMFTHMTLFNRRIEEGEQDFRVEWNKDDVIFNQSCSIPYEEVMSCYEETDEYGQESVYIVFKNGMIATFECCGELMEK